jgi:hypothetical protein
MTARWLHVAHHLAERTRLYSPTLRRDDAACERAADAIAAIDGVRDVRVRPYTGSVLVTHAPTVTIAALVDALRAPLAIDRVLAAGESPPLDPDVPAMSALARMLVATIHDLDRDIRRASGGTVDLGTVATFGLFGAGAIDVAATGQLPMPPWFQLAWWGFRTFVTTEQAEINAETNGNATRSRPSS